MTVQKSYHYILMVGSVIGLVASFLLMLTTLKLIENPAAQVPCNINPFVSCTGSTLTWQGNVFGFPNALLGIMAFSMLFAVGAMLYSGGRAKPPLWLLANLGLAAAFVFVNWFIFQSLYRIGTLCIYCMVVWAVTWPLFLYTTVWNIREDHFAISNFQFPIFNKFSNFINKHHAAVLVAWYLLVIFLILLRFKEYFLLR